MRVSNAGGFSAGRIVLVGRTTTTGGWLRCPIGKVRATSDLGVGPRRLPEHNPPDTVDDPFRFAVLVPAVQGAPSNEGEGNCLGVGDDNHVHDAADHQLPCGQAAQVTLYDSVHVKNAGART